jgi:hypothetical protein
VGTDPSVGGAPKSVAILAGVAANLKAQLQILDDAGFNVAAAKLSHVLDIIDVDLSVLQAGGASRDVTEAR